MSAFDDAADALGGTVGSWKFNDSSGNAADSSGNSLTAVKTGTVTYGQTSIISNDTDTCALLDGSTGRFTVTNNALFQFADSMTLFGWIQPTLGKKTHLFERGNYALLLPGQGVLRGTSGGANSDTLNWQVVSGNTLFVALSHDKASGLQQVIINGVQKAYHQFAPGTGVAASGSNNLELGAFAGAETFQGYFQKFRALNIGVTLAQSQTLYLAGIRTAQQATDEANGVLLLVMPFPRSFTLAANEVARLTNTGDTAYFMSRGGTAAVNSGEGINPQGKVTVRGSEFAGAYSLVHGGNLGAKPLGISRWTV